MTEQVDGALHSTWRGPTGSVVLESYLVPGLAHGTPLDTAADDMDQSMGFVAPHMLEAGISSTWRIAKSWGLLTQAARPRRPGRAPSRPPIDDRRPGGRRDRERAPLRGLVVAASRRPSSVPARRSENFAAAV